MYIFTGFTGWRLWKEALLHCLLKTCRVFLTPAAVVKAIIEKLEFSAPTLARQASQDTHMHHRIPNYRDVVHTYEMMILGPRKLTSNRVSSWMADKLLSHSLDVIWAHI